MHKALLSNIIYSLSTKKINDIKFDKHLKDGRNSRVFKFKNKKNKFVIKVYNNLKRLRKEKLFYKFLTYIKLSNVPKLLFSSNKYKLAVFNFIKGKKIKKISNSDIKQLIFFLKKLNNNKNIYLPLSVDGIKNRNEHISLCGKKIEKLKLVKPTTNENKKLIKFLKRDLIPKFIFYKKKIKARKYQKFLKKLHKKNLIISPSDIGFHNILKFKKKLFFFDFEYSGLDDPVKLICDFLCQPDQKISTQQKKFFIGNKFFDKTKDIDILVDLFLPFHQIKWCCIMLNEFKFQKKNKVYLTKQLNKTIKYYNQNLKNNYGN